MKRPRNNLFCLVTINFWSCYCLRFEFLRLKKLTPIMETQVVTVSVFFKNKILEVRTIFEAISKQNKCKFLWWPNKKLIFRGLFISKFNFNPQLTLPWNSPAGLHIKRERISRIVIKIRFASTLCMNGHQIYKVSIVSEHS